MTNEDSKVLHLLTDAALDVMKVKYEALLIKSGDLTGHTLCYTDLTRGDVIFYCEFPTFLSIIKEIIKMSEYSYAVYKEETNYGL